MSNRSFGVILLCIWAIVSGLLTLTNLAIAGADLVLGFLLIASGILILLGK
jgi:hypothetical protein